ncbi:hypothetical protein [Cupriavidus metallidurans]|uniref:hypothetical protein n=1 Tax=Cupriavidus metallidurans TaxID=119219 RepID=UPI0016483C5C|nr:hypothetical protein [Cupriavidus metallidurans]
MTRSNRQLKRLTTASAVALVAMVAGCASQPPAEPIPNSGPQGGRGTPEGCQADKLGDEALIGKTEAEAAALLKGCAWRFGSRDGQSLPATMDYNPQRRSIDVVGGKVTAVRRG